ncbi:uncharacterized protein LOC119597475 [Penaeus monodon]|uniref:uncharacterized protein LOC119597475 n=1 Tax=Penaeus monodon TaxID=6687 RepID=UPI0018A721C8|nr:uncharacterized protein LOC119597475 [Penaeus monodon]
MAAATHRTHQKRKRHRGVVPLHLQGHHCTQTTHRGRRLSSFGQHGELGGQATDQNWTQQIRETGTFCDAKSVRPRHTVLVSSPCYEGCQQTVEHCAWKYGPPVSKVG